MQLVIGNKNYSSWSLRPWIALKTLGFEFEERRIPLYGPGSRAAILEHSPAGKVPILIDGRITVWDSLAILEYLAEKNPALSPSNAPDRARARSVAAEMHSGFPNLRNHMSMNVRRRYPGKGRTPEVLAEIGRITAIWAHAKALRFRTYEVELTGAAGAHCDALLALPAMQEWIAAAEREMESIAQFELYG